MSSATAIALPQDHSSRPANATALFRRREEADRDGRGLGLALRGLRKSFGALDVLKHVDLDVCPGEFVAIVGRSGCGKSTLLRILAGLDSASDGAIHFVESGTGERAKPRIMFQEPRLLPWARVLDNVEVGLGQHRTAQDGRQRALATLRAVGLEEKALQWPSILSGGQRQRVSLARALVSKPRLLLLDEPLGALDALTRLEMQALVERIWQAQRFTAVLVTHDVAEAVNLADRVLLIDEGRITLDLVVDLPRPRRRGSLELAKLEARILAELLQGESGSVNHVS